MPGRCRVRSTSLSRRRRTRVDQGITDATDCYQHGHGHAALTGRAVGSADRGVGGDVQVGVGKDDHVVLRAAEGLHPLSGGGAGLVHVAGHRRGAHEADGRRRRVLEEAVDRHPVALDDVEHAVRQARPPQQLSQQHRWRPDPAPRA